MRLILDSPVLLAIALRRLDRVSRDVARVVEREDVSLRASAASYWEIAIKTRLGKRDPSMLVEALPSYIEAAGIEPLPVTAAHAVAAVEPLPPTRDPFDRLLLAQCLVVEDRRLLILDGALVDHPPAARLDGPAGMRPS